MESKVRRASHAGTWYTNNRNYFAFHTKFTLHKSKHIEQVAGYMAFRGKKGDQRCKAAKSNHRTVVFFLLILILIRHAGYAYSGPPAAWAY